MQKSVYSFTPVKIHRVEGTSLALSFEMDEKQSDTTLRFYEVNDEDQTYKRIGIRIIPMPLYASLKTHRKAISEAINKFMDVHPQHEHLLRH